MATENELSPGYVSMVSRIKPANRENKNVIYISRDAKH